MTDSTLLARRMRWLSRFAPLYRSARLYGADRTLRTYLGLDESFVLPLTLAHGIDFGQIAELLEANAIEPLYWAHNERAVALARAIKQPVAIPHPFLLEARAQGDPPANGGLLVVGNPPSPDNDRWLHEALVRHGITEGTVLVKPRGPCEGSKAFWRARGFDTIQFGSFESTTYKSMASLLAGYGTVVAANLSSVITYAAALGARIELIADCRVRAYEVAEIEQILPKGVQDARNYARLLASDDHAAKTAAARGLLGATLNQDSGAIREALERAIVGLESPIHFPARYPLPVRWGLGQAARLTKRPGLVSRPLRDRLRSPRLGEIAVMEINEVAYWIDGDRDRHFSFQRIPYRSGLTEPGFGVGRYPGE